MKRSQIIIVSAPSAEPISTEEAKSHLRVTNDDELALINALIKVSREAAEKIQGRALITQTLEIVLDQWPFGSVIELPRSPLQSVTSIKYKDSLGVEYTFPSANYIVDAKTQPGRISLVSGAIWPTVTLREIGAITIQFKAGYGDAAANVPATTKQAMLLMVGHWFEHREEVIIGSTPAEVPFAAKSLLNLERMNWV